MIYILVNSDLTGVEERVTCDTPGWPPSPPHLTCPPTGENYHQHNQRNLQTSPASAKTIYSFPCEIYPEPVSGSPLCMKYDALFD